MWLGQHLCLSLALLAADGPTPAMVDLRPDQTPVRNQGERGNCFIHATVAAMEAALNRQGHTNLDLAEEFSDYVGSLLYLEINTFDGTHRLNDMRVPGR